MEEDMLDLSDDHSRTIIHIDIDCFYAQVEEILDPSLRTSPLGIQQKNIIVTCNYVARELGIGKLMLLADAQKICPNLVLVNGEDLTNYRKMSARIFDVLTTFTDKVEKLGMDENYLDVSSIIEQKLRDLSINNDDHQQYTVDGYLYPEQESLAASCSCGCAKRLTLGSHLAAQIRNKLFTELNITSCAGIAHNKLMAKIIGSRHKPNKQTILVPSFTVTVLSGLGSLRHIVGIGEKTESLLNEIGCKCIGDLQEIEFIRLATKFGHDMATKLKKLSYGRDTSPVKLTGKPKSISLEDSCRSISLRADVEDKFRLLLIRLINQVTEDGRIPIIIKIILRKYDPLKKSSHRETKQANIMPSMFKQLGDGKIILNDGSQEKLLKIVMRLFERSVDLKRPFNITLLGLAFSKFQEKKKGSNSIANFLIKKSEVEVQSITSLSSDGFSPNSSETHRYVTSSPMHMDFESISDTSHASCSSDVSESEIEPSPKKTRIGFLIAKRSCLSSDAFDVASPSKLRVADLRLNSKEFDRDQNQQLSPVGGGSASAPFTSTPNQSLNASSTSLSSPISLFRSNTLSLPLSPRQPISLNTSVSMDSSNFSMSLPPECPPTVDRDVFKELPMDVQQELLTQWRTPTASSSTSAVAAAATSSSLYLSQNIHPQSSVHSTTKTLANALVISDAAVAPNANNTIGGSSSGGTSNNNNTGTNTSKNTLHRYFIANKQH